MAIKGKFTYRGVEMDEAYVRIDEIHGGKLLGWRGVAKLYYSEATAQAPGTVNALTSTEVSVSKWEDGLNPYAILYEELKKQEAFKDFVDA